MTAGQGRYTIALSHYDPVPPSVQQQLMAQFKVKEED
jgi:elongation factor G